MTKRCTFAAMNLKEYVMKGMRYEAFRDHHAQLVREGKTTGHNQSEQYLAYARLNQHRMERVEKTLLLNEKLVMAFTKLKQPVTALIITEGWCGDSAQNIPVFHKLERAISDFSTSIILRDDNPEIMDHYLTNGSKSIPKVVFINNNTGQELGVWGPRPAPAQKIMDEAKAKNLPKEEASMALHLWYSKDKTQTMQREILQLVEKL